MFETGGIGQTPSSLERYLVIITIIMIVIIIHFTIYISNQCNKCDIVIISGNTKTYTITLI